MFSMNNSKSFLDSFKGQYIFDSLTHTTPDGRWFSTSIDASLSRLLNHIKEFHVTKSILSGFPDKKQNDYILDVYRNYPDLFYPVPALIKQPPKMILRTLKNYRSQGVRAVKIHPRFVGLERIDDPWLDEVMSICEEERFILFLCTVFKGISCDSCSIPKKIGYFCKKYNQLKFVLLHGGFNDVLQTSEEIRLYENALLDISSTLTRFYDSSIGLDIKFLIRTFDRRLVIGTDFPENTYKDIFSALSYLGFSSVDILKKPYMGDNLFRFLTTS